MERADPITQTLEKAVREQVFPGAVLRVHFKGAVVYQKAVGRVGYRPQDGPTHPETMYDLASLTKPLATATAILCLIQDGLMMLDQPIEAYLKELTESPVGQIPIRQLLQHQSGLPAWRPYYQDIDPTGVGPRTQSEVEARKRAVLNLIKQELLAIPPDPVSLYSDLGFILLGFAIERCANQSLARFCHDRIYKKAEAEPLWFFDYRKQPIGDNEYSQVIAPTEQDPWRGRMVQGEVHDENSYVLGGITGHAGIFGTVSAVSTMADCWMQSLGGRSLMFSSPLAQEFVTPQTGGKSGWALGWDTPTPPSSSGSYFSSKAFGHLGYTGTSVWIDPEVQLQVVLLTNRVHPTRDNTKIQCFRPKIHNIVYETFIG